MQAHGREVYICSLGSFFGSPTATGGDICSVFLRSRGADWRWRLNRSVCVSFEWKRRAVSGVKLNSVLSLDCQVKEVQLALDSKIKRLSSYQPEPSSCLPDKHLSFMPTASNLPLLDTLDKLVLGEERFIIACIVNLCRELCWIGYRARAQPKHASQKKR